MGLTSSVRRLGVACALAVAASAFAGMWASPASAADQPSAKVAVIPGFAAPVYPGSNGIPDLPTTSPLLSAYSFTQLGTGFSSASLKPYDTVILYGLRWNTLSPTAQAAVNAFAKTGKVLIWDSDSTGSQSYGSFIHPFSTVASGESGASAGSVATFPGGANPLASSTAGNPLYLDPKALTANTHLIGHMNVLRSSSPDWVPALIAQNASIPSGGWALAWGYGVTADHTGMVVYSGLDADAFHDSVSPNYALKELKIELEATFSRAVDSTCSPNCTPPVVTTGGGGGGGAGGGGGGGTFAQCKLEQRAPAAWVHGTVSFSIRASVATGLKVRVLGPTGRAVGTARATKPGHQKVAVNTKLLPSNRRSKVSIVVTVGAVKACTLPVFLKVDNTPPRLTASARNLSTGVSVTFRVSEASSVTVVAGHTVRRSRAGANKTVTVTVAPGQTSVRVTARDRAGNTVTKRVAVG